MTNLTRCAWVPADDELYQHYHDTEWGVPVHDDVRLFEFLILEGAQAGLSWRTVLGKRARYRQQFHGFDPAKVAQMTDAQLEQLLLDPGLIRNRLKIFSARKNARVFLEIQKEFGSFDAYLWGWVGGQPIQNTFATLAEVPARTELSDQISKDMKKRGMSFVGSTIVYAYLQAVGVVNDHTADCFRYHQV